MNNNSGICPQIQELLALKYSARGIKFFDSGRVNSNISGTKMSIARGRGMDFDEVRQYQAGDDIRLIHWSLTARLGKPYTKIYKEERERSVYLVIDQSSSMHFGTKVCFKNVLAAKVAAVLGWAALSHHEQIGGIVFNDANSEYIKPQHSRQNLLQIFNLLNNNQIIKHYSGGLGNNLKLLMGNIQSGSVVIIVSDFFNLDSDAETYLKLINRKAEIINIMTYDPLEKNLPDFGNYNFTDDGKSKLEIAATKKNKQRYSESFLERLNKIRNLSLKNKMQFVELATNDNVIQTINHGISKYGY